MATAFDPAALVVIGGEESLAAVGIEQRPDGAWILWGETDEDLEFSVLLSERFVSALVSARVRADAA